jgi:hypothetical protein
MMDNIYEVGTMIAAQNAPDCTLVINRYIKRIYYCVPVNDPNHRVLAYYERELIPPAAPLTGA